MSIKLLDDQILISIDEEQKRESGIIIPDTAQQDSQIGTIVEVGPGKLHNDGHRISLEVKVGNKVMFKKFAGTKLTAEMLFKFSNDSRFSNDSSAKNYMIIKSSDVLMYM